MSMYPCQACGKENESTNYCDWACSVTAAERAGGQKHCPNGLPVASIRHDCEMFEHAHGDHPDYKFPVDVEYIGVIGPEDSDDYRMCGGRVTEPDEAILRAFKGEVHALIYTDGGIALTLYECCYCVFTLSDGMCKGSGFWKRGDWRLSQKSLNDVRGFVENHHKQHLSPG